ncbi:hypothetical protein DRW42_21720 [Pedobacter miscanthi]|uniref:Uncharacterized protein n=1 Tax=Pedobacter miscanthi TaxID=2259170 RepID=A0A366KPF6_9SPHI|nr:hypothetical protein DRW42_21720 [Pedobacter miscanthi]
MITFNNFINIKDIFYKAVTNFFVVLFEFNVAKKTVLQLKIANPSSDFFLQTVLNDKRFEPFKICYNF